MIKQKCITPLLTVILLLSFLAFSFVQADTITTTPATINLKQNQALIYQDLTNGYEVWFTPTTNDLNGTASLNTNSAGGTLTVSPTTTGYLRVNSTAPNFYIYFNGAYIAASLFLYTSGSPFIISWTYTAPTVTPTPTPATPTPATPTPTPTTPTETPYPPPTESPTTSPTPVPSFITPSPAPYVIVGDSNLTLYFRGDAYSFNGATGYGLYNTASAETQTVNCTSAGPLPYPMLGFRVWIVHNTEATHELTGGSPTALIDPLSNSTTSTWLPMETRISSNQDVIQIKLYLLNGTNNWIEQATYVSAPIQSNTLLSTTWTFNCNSTGSWDGSNYTLAFNFGGAANSYISGVSFTPHTYTETLNVKPFWQYLAEGNLLGFFNAIYLSGFILEDILIGVFVMLFLGPLYIRTKSLLLVCVIWILLGGFLITAAPALSGIALIFLILGVAGVFYKLVRPS